MIFRSILPLLFFFSILPRISNGQNNLNAFISGNIKIDNTWDRVIYLSHIPTFEEMYLMSYEMILAKTEIDSLGNFRFDIDFLPNEDNLYRLHIVKRGDTPATLIIGGKDENHMFLIANGNTNFHLSNNSTNPPFRNLTFKNSEKNTEFHQISQMVFKADSIAAESSASKRSLIENQLQKDLLVTADTSSNILVSLFAIYKSKFESNYSSNLGFYKSYLKKWRNQENNYFRTFQKQLPVETEINIVFIIVLLAFILTIAGFFLGKKGFNKSRKLEKLSIQERKIYELLQKGATNQEISNHFNIGLSTVKSHVGSIYSKLKVKTRKDIVDMK